jgi:hypothetical protein
MFHPSDRPAEKPEAKESFKPTNPLLAEATNCPSWIIGGKGAAKPEPKSLDLNEGCPLKEHTDKMLAASMAADQLQANNKRQLDFSGSAPQLDAGSGLQLSMNGRPLADSGKPLYDQDALNKAMDRTLQYV